MARSTQKEKEAYLEYYRKMIRQRIPKKRIQTFRGQVAGQRALKRTVGRPSKVASGQMESLPPSLAKDITSALEGNRRKKLKRRK